VKLGRTIPGHEIPDWISEGHVIRGAAAGTAAILPRGWRLHSELEIKELLGYSLKSLYPTSWPTPPPLSLFD
jgi:hypothetical protein